MYLLLIALPLSGKPIEKFPNVAPTALDIRPYALTTNVVGPVLGRVIHELHRRTPPTVFEDAPSLLIVPLFRATPPIEFDT